MPNGRGSNQYATRPGGDTTSNRAAHHSLVAQLDDDDQDAIAWAFGSPESKPWTNMGVATKSDADDWQAHGFTDAALAGHWIAEGFTDPEEAQQWREVLNLSIPGDAADTAAMWKAEGLTPEEASPWWNAKFGAKYAARAIREGVTVEDALHDWGLHHSEYDRTSWSNYGLSADDYWHWKDTCGPLHARDWIDAGVDRDEAKRWHAQSLSADDREAWLEAGITDPDDARQLMVDAGRDGDSTGTWATIEELGLHSNQGE